MSSLNVIYDQNLENLLQERLDVLIIGIVRCGFATVPNIKQGLNSFQLPLYGECNTYYCKARPEFVSIAFIR